MRELPPDVCRRVTMVLLGPHWEQVEPGTFVIHDGIASWQNPGFPVPTVVADLAAIQAVEVDYEPVAGVEVKEPEPTNGRRPGSSWRSGDSSLARSL